MAEVYQLKGNPTVELEIGGVACGLELGNYTVALEIKRWADELRTFSQPGTRDSLLDGTALEDFAASGIALVASALGDEAAERLMGGRNRLNLVRLMSILDIVMEVTASDRGIRAQEEAILAFGATGDED